MNGLGEPLKKSNPKNRKKTVKIEKKSTHVNKHHQRESELLFKHLSLLFFKIKVKNSRRKTTRFFASVPVPA